jgi:hypothetical protein
MLADAVERAAVARTGGRLQEYSCLPLATYVLIVTVALNA